MNQWTDEAVREAFKNAIPTSAQLELRRDLWPEMLRRMQATPHRVHWMEWALAAASALFLLLLPGAAQILLYFL